MTLRNNKGERITNPYGEPVLIVREYYMLSTSQQEDLRSQGITRHRWERYPLSGRAILFFTRAWEIGRMTVYVKNYHSTAEAEAYQQKLQYFENVGWRRDVPDPFVARQNDRNTGIIDAYVRKTPALWEEFVMKREDGNWYLVNPDPSVRLDIHNNLRFSPRLCLWAVERKL